MNNITFLTIEEALQLVLKNYYPDDIWCQKHFNKISFLCGTTVRNFYQHFTPEKDFYDSVEPIPEYKDLFIDIPITLIGLGGIGGNFLLWCLKHNVRFKVMFVFEPDKIYLHNIFRYFKIREIPLKYHRHYQGSRDIKYKVDYFSDLNFGFPIYFMRKRITKEDIKFLSCTVFTGTPDLKTRVLFFRKRKKLKFHFLFIQNDIWEIQSYTDNNLPLSIPSVVVENYGQLRLSRFFSELYFKAFPSLIEKLKKEVKENGN